MAGLLLAELEIDGGPRHKTSMPHASHRHDASDITALHSFPFVGNCPVVVTGRLLGLQVSTEKMMVL